MSDDNLKRALVKIKAVLEKHDIAGMVILAGTQENQKQDGPEGMVTSSMEHYIKTDPSWSIIRGSLPHIHLKSKRADYPTLQAQLEAQAHSHAMIRGFAEVCGQNALAFFDLVAILDTKMNATDMGSSKTDDEPPPVPPGAH